MDTLPRRMKDAILSGENVRGTLPGTPLRKKLTAQPDERISAEKPSQAGEIHRSLCYAPLLPWQSFVVMVTGSRVRLTANGQESSTCLSVRVA